MSNPKLKITCIDIDDTYSQPVINFLGNKFNTNIKYGKPKIIEEHNPNIFNTILTKG